MAKADEHIEQWKTVKLGEVGEINPSNKEPLPNQFIYIDLESVVAGELLTENYINKKEAPSRAQRIVYKDDVLYQTVRPYQKNNYIHKKEGDYVASTGYALIRCYKEYDPDFLYYKLHTYQIESVVLGLCTGTSYPAIAPNYLKKIEISVPSLPAQRRIAAILSAADKVIEQTRQLISKYKSIKQGMMEDLLKPKEGWKKVRLGECCIRLCNGMTYDIEERTGHLVTRIETISEGYIDYSKVGHTNYMPKQEYKLVKGDILFSHINSLKHIGKVAYYDDDIELYHGMNLLVIRTDNYIDSKYLFYQLASENVRKEIRALAKSAVNQASINTTELQKLEIKIPFKNDIPDLSEQRRIAKILLGIDKKIEAEEKVLEKYEKMKKGLMEKLLNKE